MFISFMAYHFYYLLETLEKEAGDSGIPGRTWACIADTNKWLRGEKKGASHWQEQ